MHYRNLTFMGASGYRVGDDGSLWSRWKKRCLGRPWGTESYLSNDWAEINRGCRKDTLILDNGTRISVNRGRTVLTAFVGPCPHGMECCHADDNQHNNALTNLRWDTHSGNMRDRAKHWKPRWKLSGADRTEIVRRYRAGKRGIKTQLARDYGVTLQAICKVIRKECV